MFSNLAEDVWRQFRDDPRVNTDLEAVDHGSDTLVVTTRPALKGRTIQTVRGIIDKHMMESDVRIDDEGVTSRRPDQIFRASARCIGSII